MVRTKRSAIAFAFGARTGLSMIWMPSLAKTASKSRVNLLSRSGIRRRNSPGLSWSVQVKWRAWHESRLAEDLLHDRVADTARPRRFSSPTIRW
jgi:hypothetical protein